MKTKVFACLIASAIIASTLMMSGCSSCSCNMTPSASPSSESSLPSSSAPAIPREPDEGRNADLSAREEQEERSALAMSADFLQIGALNNETVKWGPGVQQDEKGRSTACVGLQEKFGQYDVFFIAPEEENRVTLSFDQGYENGYTANILDTLKEKEVTAIFFLTGHYVRSQPELVSRMIEEGHILGNHSDSHKVYCRDLSIEESFEDARWMQDYLRDNFNYEMRLFRFPEGEFSEQSLALMQQMGYKSLFWSFAHADWDVNNQPAYEDAVEKIMKFVHPGEIMLLHSVSSTNAHILPEIIDKIRDKGFDVGPFEAAF